ncbi:Peptidoglycan-binding lysin domain protein [Metarhizium album ARSEF 1941]|uniref:Peptidoglycan-binding lysin domain protein n=1 Tax=Metarhizium album (strain ARSEF 1941) TaxID=1081103 RepID=A0A0B2WES1_METAS|nr:Peptidoglycan-binding lysin domain protein [Metarhizium album ARSEF 1941]KHN94356.1 Peptidoglycan-binding lysin domain protein [Metarhizium album ARSEF 1941]
MHLPSCLAFGSIIWSAAAASTPKVPRHDGRRLHEGPFAPGTASDCAYYDAAADSSQTCRQFEAAWGISHDDFVAWNPSVQSDCSGIEVGVSYCVGVSNVLPRSSRTERSTAVIDSSFDKRSPAPPSPMEPDTEEECQKYYRVVSGDTCVKIVRKHSHTFTLADFYRWNPALGNGLRPCLSVCSPSVIDAVY